MLKQKVKICSICEEKEAIIMHKALLTGWKCYLCEDCIIKNGELHKEAREFRKNENPWMEK